MIKILLYNFNFACEYKLKHLYQFKNVSYELMKPDGSAYHLPHEKQLNVWYELSEKHFNMLSVLGEIKQQENHLEYNWCNLKNVYDLSAPLHMNVKNLIDHFEKERIL